MPFETAYSRIYDALYSNKNYAGECALLARIFNEYAQRPIRTVLDIGCGTGGHAHLLASKGYEMTGIDISAAMLEQAMQKPAIAPIRFVQGDMRHFSLGQSFDAAIIMFSALGYQHLDTDVLSALGAASAHLQTGGILIFDVWNSPAVIRHGTSPSTKVAMIDGKLYTRHGNCRMQGGDLCVVDYTINSEHGATLFSEQHVMRHFHAEFLQAALRASGLVPILTAEFSAELPPLTDEHWNALYVARKN